MATDLQNTVPDTVPLGRKSPYPTAYNKALLEPIARERQRIAMKMPSDLNFFGFDVWNAYELFWLDLKGKPVRACASIFVPAMSPYLCESKSVKLYLNSLNHEHFATMDEIKHIVTRDLSEMCRAPVDMIMAPPHLASFDDGVAKQYRCLDGLDVLIETYQRAPALLQIGDSLVSNERMVSHLFKSHCLCTGQPDLGSIFIEYTGQRITDASLLSYLVSFRDHVGFSENCIEQIFVDLMEKARPQKLLVFGRFTRRGGIDINPYRANFSIPFYNQRLIYQ